MLSKFPTLYFDFDSSQLNTILIVEVDSSSCGLVLLLYVALAPFASPRVCPKLFCP